MTNILIHLPRFRKNDNVLKLCDPPLICEDVDHIISRCYNEDTRQGGRACKENIADLPDIARRSYPVLVVRSPQRAGSNRLSTTNRTAHERSSNQPSATFTTPAEQKQSVVLTLILEHRCHVPMLLRRTPKLPIAPFAQLSQFLYFWVVVLRIVLYR
jgi:hypothetical protein